MNCTGGINIPNSRTNLKNPNIVNISVIALLLGLLICTISIANASSAGSLVWDKTYGGPQDDAANGITNTSDGGYILTGYTSSYGNGTSGNGSSNVWLLKVGANGNEQWNKTYGGNMGDVGYSVVQADDGGYAVAGYESSYTNGNMAMYLLKTDAKGNLLWNKTYGAGVQDGAYSLAKTKDGGFIMTGFTYLNNKQGWNLSIVKTDSNGILQWNKSYGGDLKDCGHSIIQTDDGGYAIVGYTKSYSSSPGGAFGVGGEDLWLLKLDSNGNMQWNKIFGGKDYDDGFSILQNPDGGFTIAGTTQSFTQNNTPIQEYSDNDTARIYLIRTDARGNLLWNKTVGGDLKTAAFSLARAPDDGYLITGTVFSNAGDADVLALRTDLNGTQLWANSYGGPEDDYGYSTVYSSDDSFMIAGYTRSFGNDGSDVFLLKIADANYSASSVPSATSPVPSGSGSVCGSLAILPVIIVGSVLLGSKNKRKKVN